MKIGRITQLSNAPGTPNEPRLLPSAQMTLDPAMLLSRIVRIEQRLTDIALRLDAIEGVGGRKPVKGGR